MTKWQAIIFDLDDTLYPEREFVFSGFKAVAHWIEKKLQCPTEQTLNELTGLFTSGIRGNTFNLWLESRDLPPERYVADMVRIYRDHHPLIKPFPIVPDLLTSLARRYKLGLISDGIWTVQQKKFNALNLDKYFDAVVFSDQLGRAAWKPSPKPFQVILEKLDIQPFEAIYVADNPLKDFLGARRVGMKTIWCRESQGEYLQFEPPTPEHAPNMSIEHLSDLELTLVEMEKL